MSIISQLETIGEFFGAIYFLSSVEEPIDFGGSSLNPDDSDTSVTVIRGSIKVVGINSVYGEGQEFRRSITEVTTVKAVVPDTIIFHTLKASLSDQSV